MRGRRSVATAAMTGALLLMTAGTATAAGPGETFLVGGLPLPAGAIAGGDAGRGEPERTAVSADGRYVAFVALADGLSPEAGVDLANVYRKDRQTGEVVLVSRADGVVGAAATRSSREVSISADGNRVGFVTEAGLDPGDGDGVEDVYVRDVAAGRTLLATAATTRAVDDYDLSGDGAFVAFSSPERFDGDANTVDDIFRRTLASGVTRLVSAADNGMIAGDGNSNRPSISDDGDLVAFTTTARNLGFTSDGSYNVAVRQLSTRRTALISHQRDVFGRGGNNHSEAPAIAGDATAIATAVVAFESQATDLADGDADADYSVYAGTATTNAELISRADGVNGASGDGTAYAAAVSDDGRRVAFTARAGNLGGTEDAYGTYVRDRAGARTSALSNGSEYAIEATIAGDGGYVAWFDEDGAAYGLDPDLYPIVGRAYAPPPASLGAVEELSRPAGGAPWVAPAVRVSPAPTGASGISGDGRYVLLNGGSGRLEGGPTTQVYRRDTLTGALELVSRLDGPGGAPVPYGGYEASISADGNRVAFATESPIDPDDGGEDGDVYVRDVAAGTTTLVSRADGAAGAAANRGATDGRIAADGRHVAFTSTATNLGAADGRAHVYLRDLVSGTTVLVDRADGAGPVGNGAAADPSVSADGSRVAFRSGANNLDPADPAPDIVGDIYVRDLPSGDTQLVSRRSGADGAKGTVLSMRPAISGNGRVVAFIAYDDQLAPEAGAWASAPQVVARDLATQQTVLVSRAAGAGATPDRSSSDPAIDGSGDRVSFSSNATNLLPGRGGAARSSVFVRTLSSGALDGPPPFGLPGNDPQNRSYGGSLSLDGQCLLFVGLGHNAITGAAGDFETGYVHTVSGSCPKPLPERRGPGPEPRRDDRGARAPAKPVLSKVSLLRRRFRVGKAATAVTAAARRAPKKKRKPTPAGTAIRFTLNARANVTIAIERNAGRGRLVGRACRRATRKLRKKRACTRWTKVGALTRKGLDAGRRSVAFSGRIGRRALGAGGYRLTVKAANAAGSSKPATLAFTVVRR